MAGKDEQNGKKHLKNKKYVKELTRLQAGLCKLQAWVKYKGLRVIVVFEGFTRTRSHVGSDRFKTCPLVHHPL
jgi:polyphosphate kinase 2 (PPK2 family)